MFIYCSMSKQQAVEMSLAFKMQSGAICRTEGLTVAAVKVFMLWADPWRHVCGRWNDAMESPTLKKEHWRKSGQWFVLNRRHVQIVVNDTEVAQAFKECVRYLFSFRSALQQCSVIWHPCGIAQAPILLARLLLDELQSGCKSRQHVVQRA